MAGFFLSALSSGNVQLAPVTSSLLPLGMTSNSQASSRPSSSRQARSSRPSPPPVPSLSAPNGLSAPSLSTLTIKGHPCVYTKEYQEYHVERMEELEKGKGKDWSVKKREFKVMREWEKEWKKRNGNQNGGEQESISQDGDSSDFGAVLSKSTIDEKSFNLASQRNSLPSLLRNPPSSLSSDSSSSSDPDFVADSPDPHPDHLPSSITHAIHSEVRKIYESPKKKAPSSFIGPIHGSAGVEVEIEEGGQKHMHWLEKEGEEEGEKQRNLEDEMDEEEDEDYLSKEDRQEKMGSLLERIGVRHDGEDEEEERDDSEKGEVEQKVEEIGGILEESLTTIHGVVEMEEDEEGGDHDREEMEEIEEQARQTFADSGLLQQLKDNYRCDCYDGEDQEMMKGVNDQYGMGIEGGLNSNSEEEGGDDSPMSLPNQQPQRPSLQPTTEQHLTKDDKSTKLKNLRKKEQKKRKKEERKRAKLAGELEKVKGEKRKAVDEVVSLSEGGSTEPKKRKRKSEKGKGLNA